MTPFEVLQWIGVVFVGLIAVAVGIVAIKAAITPAKHDDPTHATGNYTADERRNDT